jgi:purine-binding chemotaxis protein CheW
MTSGPIREEIPRERLAAAAAAVPRGRDSLLGFADAMDDFSQQAQSAPADVELHLVTFHLGAEEFGIPIETVREVLRVGDITRVPQAPPHVKGITNLRGRIVPIVSIKTRMGLPDTPLTVRSRCVLVEVHGRLLGLLVDAVSSVVKVPAAAVAPPPEEIMTAATDYITGVARMGSRLIILLQLEKALLLDARGDS